MTPAYINPYQMCTFMLKLVILKSNWYLFNDTGQYVRQINCDNVDDVRFHSGRLFCLSGESGKGNVAIQVYESLTWQRIRLIQIQCKCKFYKHHPLHVGSEYITLACCDNKTIHSMTHTGDLVHVTNFGLYPYPRLCKTESNAVLVAAWEEGSRLYLGYERKWSRVLLDLEPKWSRDAVYVGGALFVLSSFNHNTTKIIKYVSIK